MKKPSVIAIALFLSSIYAIAFPGELLNKPDDWYQSAEGRKTTANIISWQSSHGSWPKNQDTTLKEYYGDRKQLSGTFDNGATTGELRYLARAFRATNDQACSNAFLSGFDHILKAQYPNGGWPQYFPLSRKYHRRITFNDGTMIRLLELLREVANEKEYAFLNTKRRSAARKAFDRGVECIVKCQIVVRGTPTVWCAQHDEVTLAPAAARAYELPSLSGSESAGILCFLMTLEQPSPEVVRAVKAGVAWFDAAKIEGIRIEKSGGDRKVVKDSSAPPMWARFYEIETNRPFFCDRDGVKKYDISEIGPERRNGYAWYGNWGVAVASAFLKTARGSVPDSPR